MSEVKTPSQIIEEITGKPPKREYKLVYNSPTETLEPVYFWILDFMNNMFRGKVEKLIDNFVSTAGSGHFSELMQKATAMRDEAMKIYGMINTVIKSIINLIYDLKEFELRLKEYERADSKDPNQAQSGMLSLKQVWMDQVDIKKGVGSINSLTQGQLNFVTLRDAFMASKDLDAINKLDLNERVQRILRARLGEFLEWKDRSHAELQKRFEIEKTYLRTQVETVKMYSRWVKPYLVATQNLTMKDQDRFNPDMVNAFNTIMLELTLLGASEIDVVDDSYNGKLPEDFRKIKFKRKYFSCVLVDLKFRGIPQKAGQHYVFGGKADVSFKSYALNDQQLKLLKYKLSKSDLDDSLKMIEGMTDDSIGELKKDIERYLEGDDQKKAAQEQEKKQQDVNPFAALLGIGTAWKKKSKKPKLSTEEKAKSEKESKERKLKELDEKGISKDTYAESVIRAAAEAGASKSCYTIYDIYKKAHGMASTPHDV